MELPPDIRSMVSRFEGGVLIGALGFQATLTLPLTKNALPSGVLAGDEPYGCLGDACKGPQDAPCFANYMDA